MAKDKDRERRDKKDGKREKAPAAAISPDEAGGGQHHAAAAHGKPTRVDESLPATREELLALHAEARKRRAAAPLGGPDYQAAIDELTRIEVRIAAIERAANPPLG
jgi:hypothetical protein